MNLKSGNGSEIRGNIRLYAALCIAGVLLNLIPSRIMEIVNGPLWLDTIGTVLTAVLGGYLPGILVGFVTNLLKGFSINCNNLFLFFLK